MGRLEHAVALALILLLSPQAVHAQAAPARYTPLMQGWESFFSVTSEPIQRWGRPWVAGYVSNEYGFSAARVQLLVNGLDQTGQVVSQRVSWLGSPVGPGSRVYFEVPAPGPAVRYHVSVFAYDWVQTAS